MTRHTILFLAACIACLAAGLWIIRSSKEARRYEA